MHDTPNVSTRRLMVVTGASGYIGSRVVSAAVAAGWRLRCLGRAPDTLLELESIPWRFGEAIPENLWQTDTCGTGVHVVVHIAHDWNQDARSVGENLNLLSSAALLKAARKAGVPKFIFASSQASRPDATTGYGQCKYAIEQLLSAPGEIAARIGFVYGGDWGGPAGMLVKALRLSPVVPVISPNAALFPVHIDDVCSSLLSLANDDPPDTDNRAVIVGPSSPLSFRDFLRTAAKTAAGRNTVFLPGVPGWLGHMVAGLPFLPAGLRLRIKGLLTIQPFYEEDASFLPEDMFRPFPRL